MRFKTDSHATSVEMSSFITSFDELQAYDAVILDLWGTLHNGKAPFEGALKVLDSLMKNGKHVVFLSNSARTPASSSGKLSKMGVPPGRYSSIATSGGHLVECVKHGLTPLHASLGARVYFYGPPLSGELATIDAVLELEENGPSQGQAGNATAVASQPQLDERHTRGRQRFKRVHSLEEADWILMTDMLSESDTVESVQPFFRRALELNLPIIAGNGDNMVMLGEKECVCAGAVARWYKSQGGRVHIHGKPSVELFASAHACLPAGIPKPRILMIGDALETDIAGASAYGIDSLLVCTGIHGKDFPDVTASTVSPSAASTARLAELCALHGVTPTYWAHGLTLRDR